MTGKVMTREEVDALDAKWLAGNHPNMTKALRLIATVREREAEIERLAQNLETAELAINTLLVRAEQAEATARDLEAALERLKQMVKSDIDKSEANATGWLKQIGQAEAERDRLREALAKISDHAPWSGPNMGDYIKWIQGVAIEALTPTDNADAE